MKKKVFFLFSWSCCEWVVKRKVDAYVSQISSEGLRFIHSYYFESRGACCAPLKAKFPEAGLRKKMTHLVDEMFFTKERIMFYFNYTPLKILIVSS